MTTNSNLSKFDLRVLLVRIERLQHENEKLREIIAELSKQMESKKGVQHDN